MLKVVLASTLFLAPGSVVLAAPVLDPANGHYYELVDLPGATWSQANFDAKARTYLGHQGHLATITSPEEDNFLIATFGADGLRARWLGGYQDQNSPYYTEPSGAWTWVTGEPWLYTHWGAGEPNDGGQGNGGTENWLVISIDFSPDWNDITSAFPASAGYVIEYEDNGNELGGSVVQMKSRVVRCENVTTGQMFKVRLPGNTWNCVALGLIVSPGDEVRTGADGFAQ